VVYDSVFKRGTKMRKESREETIQFWRRHFDLNHDGQMSWDEFKESMKVIQDAEELEKLLDKAMNAPDENLDAIGKSKFLYTESMISLFSPRSTSRKKLIDGKRVPRLDLVLEVLKIFFQAFPEIFDTMKLAKKAELRAAIMTKVEKYEADSKSSPSSAHSTSSFDGEPLLSPQISIHTPGSKKRKLSDVDYKKSKSGTSPRSPSTSKVEISNLLTNSTARQLSDLMTIYLKTWAAFIEAAEVNEPSKDLIDEHRLDLYSISQQVLLLPSLPIIWFSFIAVRLLSR